MNFNEINGYDQCDDCTYGDGDDCCDRDCETSMNTIRETISFDYFKTWLTNLVKDKKGSLPDTRDWREIFEQLNRVENPKDKPVTMFGKHTVSRAKTARDIHRATFDKLTKKVDLPHEEDDDYVGINADMIKLMQEKLMSPSFLAERLGMVHPAEETADSTWRAYVPSGKEQASALDDFPTCKNSYI